MISLRAFGLALIFLLISCAGAGTRDSAQPARRQPNPAPQLGPVIQELLQVEDTGPGLRMALWLPIEAWVALVGSSGQPESETRKALAPLEDYIVIAAVDLAEGGREPGATKESIAKSLKLVDPNGASYDPIPESDLSPTVRGLFEQLAPILKNSFGNVGESYHLFAVQRTFDPLAPGQITIVLLDSEFRWRLPLGALSAPRKCPVDGEELSGAWDYCPWHGAELEAP